MTSGPRPAPTACRSPATAGSPTAGRRRPDANLLSIDGQPDGATEICALVATPADDPDGGHRIADVDGDGEPDPDSGDCFDVSGMAEGDSRFD